jgi:hypothetical protein
MEKDTTRRKIANNASARRLARRNHWRYGSRTHYNGELGEKYRACSRSSKK